MSRNRLVDELQFAMAVLLILLIPLFIVFLIFKFITMTL